MADDNDTNDTNDAGAAVADQPDDIQRLTDVATSLAGSVTALGEQMTASEERNAAVITGVVDSLDNGEPLGTPSRTTNRGPRISVPDRFREMGFFEPTAPEIEWAKNDGIGYQDLRQTVGRANLEVAMMIYGGMGEMRRPVHLDPPEDLKRAWQDAVFGDAQRTPWVGDGEGRPVRAMDTAETGFGLELIGTQFITNLWAAARNADSIVSMIRTIPMTAPTSTIPIDGDLPEMLFVGESTSASASAYATSKTGSGNQSLSAKKFTIQQRWSAELNEDSIIAYTPFLREKLNQAAALYLGSTMYNGDTTNAGTGNINLDDADPSDTKHYLAYDGIRHYWLVTDTGQGKDMGNVALDPSEIVKGRGKLNGGDDDIDALIKNVNWGMNARDLVLVMDWDTYMGMLELNVVKTLDQYGPAATVLTGELAKYQGIPIIAPSYASKTEADGKASTTESNNSRGQITLFNPAGFLAGQRREMQLFFDRIQGTDQFLFELYTRRGFTRHGSNVAAGIYNIAVA